MPKLFVVLLVEKGVKVVIVRDANEIMGFK